MEEKDDERVDSLYYAIDAIKGIVHPMPWIEEEEYREIRQRIEDDYKRRIETLELLWKVSSEVLVEGSGVNNSEIVRTTIRRMPEEFSVKDVRARVNGNPLVRNRKEEIPRHVLYYTIRRMEQEGEIRLVERHPGSKPNIYAVSEKTQKKED